MATIVKDLGAVTAYAYAVAGGYSGTEAEFEALLGNIAEDLSEIENLSVTVTTLPAGSSATASYSNGVLSLGIPKGDKGDKGDTGATGATGPQGIPGDVANLASAYSTSSTYGVGDYCIYNSQLYRCTTAITTAEAWTAAHWTSAVLGDDVSDLKSAVDDVVIISETQPQSENNKIWIDSDAESVQVPTMDDMYDMLPTETATNQDVATFTDCADDVPVKLFEAKIVFVQSGTGDPTGENIRKITGFTGMTISKSGADTSNPTTIPVSWQSEAGVVYGGTLNVLTGVLTVNLIKYTLDGSTIRLASWPGTPQSGYSYYLNKTLPSKNNANYYNYSAKCTHFKATSTGVNNMTPWQYVSGSGNVNTYIFVLPDDYSTEESANLWLASQVTAETPVEFVLYRDTPQTYQLDKKIVKSILGETNIWTDTGKVSVTIRADIGLYIQEHIGS